MGATFVIFTITIGRAQGTSAPLPLLILGGAAFLSAICAVLAVLPVTACARRTASPTCCSSAPSRRMDEEEFVERAAGAAAAATTASTGRWRATSTRTASVLQNKKYRMLGYAYRIFLVGLVASCAAYVVAVSRS